MSKRVFHHPPEKPSPTGRKYWRSLGELHGTPEFKSWLEREFPDGASELNEDPSTPEGLSRRNFLHLMGASMALAGLGLSSCRRPEAQLVPFVKSVEWLVPGRPLFYATAMPRRFGALPLVATVNDGRPTKLEGNPLHPASNGGTDAFAQCSLLDLYDPDRSRMFLENGKRSDENSFLNHLKDLRAQGLGSETAILIEEAHSPTRDRLQAEVARQFPGIQWVTYDPLQSSTEADALRKAYGEGTQWVPQFKNADIILSLDSDFLHVEEGGLQASRDFANRRRVAKAGDKMNRLYVVENHYTITGTMADHRLRCPAGQIAALAIVVAQRVAAAAGGSANLIHDLIGLDSIPGVDQLANQFAHQEAWIAGVVQDLIASPGRSLVIAGSRQPAIVHFAAHAINSALGNLGNTIKVAIHEAAVRTSLNLGPRPTTLNLAQLAAAIADRSIKNLFILGANPAYNAYANLDWATLQKNVPNVVRLGYYEDETSALSRWHIPAAHYLESWGDVLGADGTYMAVQPMIMPLFNGWSELDFFNTLLGRGKVDKPDLIRETFGLVSKAGAPSQNMAFEQAWNDFLRNGFVQSEDANNPNAGAFNLEAARAHLQANGKTQLLPPPTEDALEAVLVADYKMNDGRYNNNGWLQEMPDPITKITWDNAAYISPATARRLGLVTGNIVEMTAGSRKLLAPVWLAPGHVDNSVTLTLGYGRQKTGRIGTGAGYNAYTLRTIEPNGLDNSYVISAVKLKKTNNPGYQFASTQDHQSMEGRNIVRELPVKLYEENAGYDEEGRSFVGKMGMDEHIPANVGFYNSAPLDSMHQWGMAIDLNTCTGCNACVVACQSENNIPIVGRDQVRRGRAMHWMRIDRYYTTISETDEDPQILTQPMMCQHCENAPCETVCPVNATVHSEEGLNLMAYNRCVGTRYCSNNCPYKVRRFNFFNYNERPIVPTEGNTVKTERPLYYGPLEPKGMPEISQLQKNPNVTVRIRGVMEKCTFCIQRIEEAKIDQLREARDSDKKRIATDSFKTACQQVCPTESIIFGNLSDPQSKVNQIKAQDRDYKVLEYLNVRPRVSYQARLRNPNAAIPGSKQIGMSLIDDQHAPGMLNGHLTNEAPLPGDGLPKAYTTQPATHADGFSAVVKPLKN